MHASSQAPLAIISRVNASAASFPEEAATLRRRPPRLRKPFRLPLSPGPSRIDEFPCLVEPPTQSAQIDGRGDHLAAWLYFRFGTWHFSSCFPVLVSLSSNTCRSFVHDETASGAVGRATLRNWNCNCTNETAREQRYSLYPSWRAVGVWNMFRRCSGFQKPTLQSYVEIGMVREVNLTDTGPRLIRRRGWRL